MNYKFYIVPEPDCCDRCANTAFLDPKTRMNRKIHMVSSDDEPIDFSSTTGELRFTSRAGEGRTGLLHYQCRCRAFVFEATEEGTDEVMYQDRGQSGVVVSQEGEKLLERDSSQARVQEGMEDTVVVPKGARAPLAAGSDEEIRKRFRGAPVHTRKDKGNPFSTVISNVLTLIINSVFKLKEKLSKDTNDAR